MTPVQILWVNMITAVTLGIALGFESPESNVMIRGPHPADEPILSKLAVWRTLFVGSLMLLGVTAVFIAESSNSIPYARTVAVNTLVSFEAVYLLSSRRLHTSVLSISGLRGNVAVPISIVGVIVFQMLFTYQPTLSDLFDSRPVSIDSWLLIMTLSMALLIIVECEKWIRNFYRGRSSTDSSC
jgi:magnesium-transporting ATPase (P-type)